MHVRHDVDRSPRASVAEAIAARHAELGTCATWYWRARHLAVRDGQPLKRHEGNAALTAVARTPGHEVALHTEALWNGAAQERASVEAVLDAPIHGSSAHGDPTCFRFQGAPNLIWAEQQGLDYTELISHAHSTPHRCALLNADGTISLTTTLTLPHHASFERSMTAGDVLTGQVVAECQRVRNVGGLLQVLNHPDLNIDELFVLLSELPADGRWNATAVEAIAWWSATHVGGAVQLDTRPDGRPEVRASGDVEGLQIETRDPDGRISVQTV